MKILTLLLALVVLCANAQSSRKIQWVTLETKGIPHARHENGFVEANGKFYLIGGRKIKPVDVFDPKTYTWSEASQPPLEIHHFQACTYKGKIYLIGAMTGKYPRETALDSVLIYDPRLDTWENGGFIPEEFRRGSAGVSMYKNVFYVAGGIIDGHYTGHVNRFDAYDPKTQQWTRVGEIPRYRDHFHAVVIEHKFYAAGGRVTSKKTNKVFSETINEVDVYDFRTGTWETLNKGLPTLRAGAATIAYENFLIVIGGESTLHKEAHKEVEVYNALNDSWISFPGLDEGRHGTQAILYKNIMYIASGSGNRGGGPELLSIEKFPLKSQ